MRTFVRLGVVAALSLLVVLAGTRLSAQEPIPPPPPPPQPEPASPPDDQKAQEAVKEAEPTEEEMKEEEPATPADKMKKEEIEKKACPEMIRSAEHDYGLFSRTQGRLRSTSICVPRPWRC